MPAASAHLTDHDWTGMDADADLHGLYKSATSLV